MIAFTPTGADAAAVAAARARHAGPATPGEPQRVAGRARRLAAREAASRQATEWARTEERIAGMASAFGSLGAQAEQAAPDAAAAYARFEEQLAPGVSAA